jgi:transposase
MTDDIKFCLPTHKRGFLARVFQGSTDGEVFGDLIEQLLLHCGRRPELRSLLIMENASFHRTERIEQLCHEAGVKFVYLPLYSLDLNPIEELFAELKAFIKKRSPFSSTALSSQLEEGCSCKICLATLAKLCFSESSSLLFSQNIAE